MKKQIIIVLSCLLCGMVQAQEKGHYLHFNVGGGLHNLSYSLQNGTQKGKAGYTLNAAYSYFFTSQWGFQTGVGIQTFNAQSTISFLSISPDVDTDGIPYVFRTSFKNSQEKQQTLNLDIPLTGQYRHYLNKKIGLLATAGAKISIPVETNYETNGGQFISSGYYSQWNVELTDMPQHGFSTFSNTFKGNYSLKPIYMAVAELGGLFKIAEKVDLYAGAYFNYGLNNVLTPDNKLIYQPDGIYNGVLASSQTRKLNPVSIGLKVGLYWHLKKAIKVEIVPEIGYAKPVEQHIQQVDNLVRVKLDALIAIKTTDTLVVAKPTETVKPKIVITEKTIVPVIQPRDTTVQEEDPFEKAKRIAATISVNFESKSNQIGDSENKKVKALSEVLKAHPDICINIFGHTDNTGSHEVNLKYGLKRALAMKQKFLLQGVSDSQMTTKSMSYDIPLVPNTSEVNKAKNRRTEITVFLKKM